MTSSQILSLICRLVDALGPGLYLSAMRTIPHLGFQILLRCYEQFTRPWVEHPGHWEVRDWWCLSCHKSGHQGVKRSKFSAAFGLLGGSFPPPKSRQAAWRAGDPQLWSLTCPHMSFLSSLNLWLFLSGALENDDWLGLLGVSVG